MTFVHAEKKTKSSVILWHIDFIYLRLDEEKKYQENFGIFVVFLKIFLLLCEIVVEMTQFTFGCLFFSLHGKK